MFQYGAFQGGAFQSYWQTSTPDTHDGSAGGLPKHVRDFYARQHALQKKRKDYIEDVRKLADDIRSESPDKKLDEVKVEFESIISNIPKLASEVYFDREAALLAFQSYLDDELLILLASIS